MSDPNHKASPRYNTLDGRTDYTKYLNNLGSINSRSASVINNMYVEVDPGDISARKIHYSMSTIDFDSIKPKLENPFNKTKVKIWQEKHNYNHKVHRDYLRNIKVQQNDIKPNFNTQYSSPKI